MFSELPKEPSEKMNKIMKISGVVVSIMLAGSVTMADSYRGGYRGDHGRGSYDRGDRGRGHYDGGRNYRSYSDGGRQCGYYRSSSGDLVFGLIGLGLVAAAVSSFDRPVYVQPSVVVRDPPQVVYVQQPVQQTVVVQPYIQPATMTINVQNSNGSMTPVTMRQVGIQWVGPRGEYYDNVPTVGQLRPLYGF